MVSEYDQPNKIDVHIYIRLGTTLSMYGLLGEVVFDFRRKTSHKSFVLFHIICKNVVEYILFIITTVQVTNAYIIYVINRAKIKPFYDIHEKR